MKARIGSLAFVLTFQCTARCGMCCFGCSPERKETIPVEKIETIIDEAKKYRDEKYPDLKTVGYSGGEPFLRYDDLLHLVKFAHERGFRVTSTTNGFWARSQEIADKRIGELKRAGLAKIALSIDMFHSEYIPIVNNKYIIEAAKKYSVACEFGSVITHSTQKIGSLYDTLGESLINVKHVVAPCLPAGAAKENVAAEDYIKDPYLFARDTRCIDLNTLAVYPDGSVYPCCSQLGSNQSLLLGNAFTDDVETLVKNFHGNVLVRIMIKHGVRWFAEAAVRHHYKDFESRRFVGLCDACASLLSDEKFLEIIRPDLNRYRQNVYQKYLHTVKRGQAV